MYERKVKKCAIPDTIEKYKLILRIIYQNYKKDRCPIFQGFIGANYENLWAFCSFKHFSGAVSGFSGINGHTENNHAKVAFIEIIYLARLSLQPSKVRPSYES